MHREPYRGQPRLLTTRSRSPSESRPRGRPSGVDDEVVVAGAAHEGTSTSSAVAPTGSSGVPGDHRRAGSAGGGRSSEAATARPSTCSRSRANAELGASTPPRPAAATPTADRPDRQRRGARRPRAAPRAARRQHDGDAPAGPAPRRSSPARREPARRQARARTIRPPSSGGAGTRSSSPMSRLASTRASSDQRGDAVVDEQAQRERGQRRWTSETAGPAAAVAASSRGAGRLARHAGAAPGRGQPDRSAPRGRGGARRPRAPTREQRRGVDEDADRGAGDPGPRPRCPGTSASARGAKATAISATSSRHEAETCTSVPETRPTRTAHGGAGGVGRHAAAYVRCPPLPWRREHPGRARSSRARPSACRPRSTASRCSGRCRPAGPPTSSAARCSSASAPSTGCPSRRRSTRCAAPSSTRSSRTSSTCRPPSAPPSGPRRWSRRVWEQVLVEEPEAGLMFGDRHRRPRRRSSGCCRAASPYAATSTSRTPAASSPPSARSTSRRCSTPSCCCAGSSTGSRSRPTAPSGSDDYKSGPAPRRGLRGPRAVPAPVLRPGPVAHPRRRAAGPAAALPRQHRDRSPTSPTRHDLLATERKVEAVWRAIKHAERDRRLPAPPQRAVRLVRPPGAVPGVGRHSPAAAPRPGASRSGPGAEGPGCRPCSSG